MTRFIVIEGNLTKDPTGGFGKDSGKAFAHLDLAVTDRIRQDGGDYIDGPPTFYRVTVFGRRAENAVNSLAKGRRVITGGQLTVRPYTRTDGQPAVSNDIIADFLGADLTWTNIDYPDKTPTH